MIYDRWGKAAEIRSFKMVLDQLQTDISLRAPWALAGYSPELAEMAQTDWQTMVATAAHRKSPLDRTTEHL